MDITPASIAQVRAGRDGRIHVVEADTANVAQQLREIDRSLVLRYHDRSDHYSVIQVTDDPACPEHLVTTCNPVNGGVDPRIVERVRKVARPEYDVGKEIDAENTRVIQEQRDAATQRTDERLERAVHEARRLSGQRGRVFVP